MATTTYDRGLFSASDVNLSDRWGWMTIGGGLLILAGLFALANVAVSTLASVFMLGGLLVAVGAVQLISVFSVQSWGGFFALMLSGILALGAGILLFYNPLASGAGLTLVIGAMMLVDGLFAIVLSMSREYANRGWTLFSGVCAVILGLMVLAEFPISALWFLGTLLGVRFLISGFEMVQLGLALRPKELSTRPV